MQIVSCGPASLLWCFHSFWPGHLPAAWFSAGQEKRHGAASPPPLCDLVQDTRYHAGIHVSLHLLSFCLFWHWFYVETTTSSRSSGRRGEYYFAPKSLSSNDNYPSLRCCFSVVLSSPLGTSTTPQMTLGDRVGPTARCNLPMQSSHLLQFSQVGRQAAAAAVLNGSVVLLGGESLESRWNAQKSNSNPFL